MMRLLAPCNGLTEHDIVLTMCGWRLCRSHFADHRRMICDLQASYHICAMCRPPSQYGNITDHCCMIPDLRAPATHVHYKPQESPAAVHTDGVCPIGGRACNFGATWTEIHLCVAGSPRPGPRAGGSSQHRSTRRGLSPSW